LAIAARQKAKFEGWLKFELARELEKKEGIAAIEVEKFNNGNEAKNLFTDIAFRFENIQYYLELKTPTVSWRMDGTQSNPRTTTPNFDSITRDAQKLASSLHYEQRNSRGIVAFVLFPLRPRENRWETYFRRIEKALDINSPLNEHCDFVKGIPLSNGNTCEFLVCCFEYPASSVF
ncbi:MAG TPA: hypothetical protein VFQ30_18995, partial [Ktedonobacteraceae bacterium]|nr:hypothetical protein [Ktedonobacteraceae bacterium]